MVNFRKFQPPSLKNMDFEWTKVHKNGQFGEFLEPETCGQTV